MYEKHFGLTASPFSIAPDPRYLFMTQQHREALAHLVYGVRNGGFVLLTGEVGTGKTTVCRALLAHIPESTDVAFVFNPRLTAAELLATVCDEFGVAYPAGNTSVKVFIDAFNAFLLESNARGRSAVLVIDEAQALSVDVLEQMRLLTNLETNERKLLRIIMVGQPELRDMLGRPELRQLAQRVTARYHLGPLSRQEVGEYLDHRLDMAGATRRLFPPRAVRRVARLSRGIPRLANTICDRALLGTYVRRLDSVPPRFVKSAASEVLGPPARRRFSLEVAMGTFFMGAAALAAAYYHYDRDWAGLYWQEDGRPQQEVAAQPEPAVEVAVPTTSTVPDEEKLRLAEVKEPAVAQSDEELFAGLGDEVARDPGDQVPTGPAGEGSMAAGGPAMTQAVGQPAPAPAAALEWPVSVPRDRSRALAFSALFERWGLLLDSSGRGMLCEQAQHLGLSCLEGLGNVGRLRRYDRPAVLTLYDRRGKPFYATLVGLAGERARLVLGGEPQEFPIASVEAKWLGHYTLLWKPPPGYRKPFSAGSAGDLGPWLEDRVARLPSNQSRQGSVTDHIVQFQQGEGLIPDGILGPQTLIQLTTATDAGVPRLTAVDESG